MWSLLLGLFPSLLKTVLEAYNKAQDTALGKYKVDGKVDVAALSALSEVERAKADILVAEQGHWFTRSIRPTFGVIVIIYMAKAVLWDKIFSVWITGHEGFTSSVGGDVGVWMGVIVSGFFLHGIAVESIKQFRQ